MNIPFITSSPQAGLADLFLDKLLPGGSSSLMNTASGQMDQAFHRILSNNIRQQERLSRTDTTDQASSTTSRDERTVRKSPLEELESQVQSLGVPLDSLTISSKDMGKFEKILKDSGLSEEQIQGIRSQLEGGSLTMDRILAAAKSAKTQKNSEMTIKEETVPLLGQFLQDLGLGAEEVKGIMDGLEAGQFFNAESLKKLLLASGGKNLRTTTLENVDPQNLKNLLGSLGISEDQQAALWQLMQKSQGRVTLEGLLGFMRSQDRPEALTSEQKDDIQGFMKNMLTNSSLKPSPYFNRIVSLLQSMGDQEIDADFLAANPAIQALRGGAVSARAVAQGASVEGGTSGFTGDGAAGSTAEGQSGGTSQAERSAANSAAKTLDQALPRALRTAVAQQVLEKMMYQVRNNVHQMKLELSPAELGRVDIQVVLRSGGLHATIIADNPQVKAALEDQLAQIKEAMAEQGLDFQRFDVSTRDDRQAGYSDREQRRTRERGETEEAADTVLEAAALGLRPAGDSLVDRMI